MILIPCEQGTPEWLSARLSIPTASAFDRILTNTGKVSTQAEAYQNTLLAEWLTGLPEGYEPGARWEGNRHTERGHALEAEARAFYTLETGNAVETVGFVTTDDGLYGCSPDGLVGSDGLVEIKSKAPWHHVAALLGRVSSEYYAQVQGQLWVTGRVWCDRVFFHPLMPSIIVRLTRDAEYLRKLAGALETFHFELEAKREKLIARGIVPIT
jgi:hypothetical protein